MKKGKEELEKAAKCLAQNIYSACQRIFDDVGMTDEVYDGEVMQALLTLQQNCEEVIEAESCVGHAMAAQLGPLA
jgi:uncharacterized protein YutE (UPF0331/DUF86 family)